MAAAEAEAGRRTLALVNMAAIMERADEALLPAVYREVGAALHAPPMGLGALTLCRSFVQAACYPLAAYAAVRYNRAHVVAAGAFLWAAATFLVAVSDTFAQVRKRKNKKEHLYFLQDFACLGAYVTDLVSNLM